MPHDPSPLWRLKGWGYASTMISPRHFSSTNGRALQPSHSGLGGHAAKGHRDFRRRRRRAPSSCRERIRDRPLPWHSQDRVWSPLVSSRRMFPIARSIFSDRGTEYDSSSVSRTSESSCVSNVDAASIPLEREANMKMTDTVIYASMNGRRQTSFSQRSSFSGSSAGDIVFASSSWLRVVKRLAEEAKKSRVQADPVLSRMPTHGNIPPSSNSSVPSPPWLRQKFTAFPGATFENIQDLKPLAAVRYLYFQVATICIQKAWRGYVGRREAARKRGERETRRAINLAAIRIQAAWRGCKGRWCAQMLLQLRLHSLCRNVAARRLQRAWKAWRARQRTKLDNLVQLVANMRHCSASTVQRVWRGYQVRKIIDEEWSNWVVKWIWDPPGKIIEVVGNFTNPPWSQKLRMSWCPRRRCYVLKLPRRHGRYELKFIVEGRYVCCGAGTVVEDGAGHFNNIVDVFDVPQHSPFVRGRRFLSHSRRTGAALSFPHPHACGEQNLFSILRGGSAAGMSNASLMSLQDAGSSKSSCDASFIRKLSPRQPQT